jgi:hypothetical protein
MSQVDFHMLDFPIESFSTFFGNTLEDAEKYFFSFKITCEVFNLNEDNVTCQLFLQDLCGNALEWFYSLFPGNITNWDLLENSFDEKCIQNVLIVVSQPPSPIWTNENQVNDLEENSNQRMEKFSSSHTAENKILQEQYFSLSYTPYQHFSKKNIKNEIEEPPPNAQEDFSQHTQVKNVETYDQQEELVE